MDIKELIKEAKLKFPINTIFRNPLENHKHSIHTVTKCKVTRNPSGSMWIYATNGSDGGACIYTEAGVWAEIISYPDNYSLHKIYELWI